MNPQKPDDSDSELIERYRQASDSDTMTPSAATRAAILAEGRRIAAQRATDSVAPRFDTNQPAANQPRWKLAAFGTFGAALFAVVLMVPRFLESPAPTVALTKPAPTPIAPAAESESALQRRENETVSQVLAPRAEHLSRKAPALASLPKVAADKPQSYTRQLDANSVGTTAGAVSAAAPAAPIAPARAAPEENLEEVTVSGARASRADDFGSLRKATLLSAVASGDLSRATQLLEQGANTEQSDALGRAPLLLAVIANRADLVRSLLMHGANPNAADHAGETPLQRARSDDRADLVTLLENAAAR